MEHLLLAPLGENAGEVLSVLSWLNCREQWEPTERRPPDSLPSVTHLWVIAPDNSGLLRRLPTRLIKPLDESFSGLAERKILIAQGVEDVFSTIDAKKMAEILYRLVLYGEGWRSEQVERLFSISVPSSRNPFVGSLHRAATFFHVDRVIQMVFDPIKGEPQPDDLDAIEKKTDQFYPSILEDEPSPWRLLLKKPWQDEFRHKRLTAANFPLYDWNRTDKPTIPTYPAEGSESLALTEGLKKIAGNTEKFAYQALACGVGPYFLRHDLRHLIDDLRIDLPKDASDIRLAALSHYLVGLSEVIKDDRKGWPGTHVSIAQLPSLCDQALTLALGKRISRPSGHPCWHLRLDGEEFLIQWKGLEEHHNCLLEGISEAALLPVLRNVLANVWHHGKVNGVATATLALTDEQEGLLMTCSNPLPPKRLHEECFIELVKEDGTMPSLLQPGLSGEPGQRDGLGLFAVARTVDRSDGAVVLLDPWLQPPPPWQDDAVDFYVGLIFYNEGVDKVDSAP